MKDFVLYITLTLLVAFSNGNKDDSSSMEDVMMKQIKGKMEMAIEGPYSLVTGLQQTIPPGSLGADPHYHPGPAVIYILEGEYLFQQDGGTPIIYNAGDYFSIPTANTTHLWGANASNTTTCRIAAMIFGQAGEPLVTFVNDGKSMRESYETALRKAQSYKNIKKQNRKFFSRRYSHFN